MSARRSRFRSRLLLIRCLFSSLAVWAIDTWRNDAAAVCDAIPGVSQTFRGRIGSINRPFAGPDDVVEIRLSPWCDVDAGARPKLFGQCAEDHLVTVVFTPPAGPRSSIILAADCDAVAAPICSGQRDVGAVCCMAVNPATLTDAGRPIAGCRAPVSGAPIGLELRVMQDPKGDAATDSDSVERRLRFRFPDTDAWVGSPVDDRTLAGPATIVVTGTDGDYFVAAGQTACTARSGATACIDELFEVDGTCGTTRAPVFAHFTALPPPNNFQTLCFAPSPPCNPTAPEARFTVDADGNILVPMDWRGILVAQDRPGDSQQLPLARLLRASTILPAFPNQSDPIKIPSNAFLSSFATNGVRVAPVFDPQTNPLAGNEATLFGTADAPLGVLRIARRSPSGSACSAGPTLLDGTPCVGDSDCNGGVCAPALFDFATRFADDVGPIIVSRGWHCDGSQSPCSTNADCASPAICVTDPGVCQDTRAPCDALNPCQSGVPCVAYRAEAADPVPLDGLLITEQMLAAVAPEAVRREDLNGDQDTTDNVLILTNRHTGATPDISVGQSSTRGRGRAVAEIHDGRFAYPALAVENDRVAFLEPEPLQGNCAEEDCDQNGDGDTADTILRVFRLGDTDATEVTQTNDAVDAAPLVNGHSVVFSHGLLFFRTSETAASRTPMILVDSNIPSRRNTTHPHLSADGRRILVKFSTFGFFGAEIGDIAVRDLDTGSTQEVFHEEGNFGTTPVLIAPDASLVVFYSEAPVLDPTAKHYHPDNYVTYLDTDTTAVLFDGYWDFTPTQATDLFFAGLDSDPKVSRDGRFSVFANGFVGTGDTNGKADVYLIDAVTGTTERMSVASDGEQGDQDSFDPIISPDGRFVVFNSTRNHTLVRNDPNDCQYCPNKLYAHDRITGFTTLLYATPLNISATSISADSRYITFQVSNPNPQALYRSRVFVRGPDTTDQTSDLSGNGRIGETVLRVYDTSSQTNAAGAVRTICPATKVAVTPSDVGSEPRAAFLRPESAGEAIGCPPTVNGSLNGDADADDDVVHLWTQGRPVENLGRAAVDISLSDRVLAALVSEEADGATRLNPDKDTDDNVVEVYRLDERDWVHPGQAADALGTSGNIVVFITPESAQNKDLNDDGDKDDRVLQIYDADEEELINVGQAAEEFVIGGVPGHELVAFRTSEAAQGKRGGQDLNGNGDVTDYVLQVYDVAARQLVNSGQSVTPCRLEACDPHVPYRVDAHTVKFLTRERDQGCSQQQGCVSGGTDLNGDGDAADLVLQTLNVRQACHTGVSTHACHAVAAMTSGVCAYTGSACWGDNDCPSGTCVIRFRMCSTDAGTPCATGSQTLPELSCSADQVCRPIANYPGDGRCYRLEHSCHDNHDCQLPARCEEIEQPFRRIVDPLGQRGAVVASVGRCVEDLGTSCEHCRSGQFCAGTTCHRDRGTCRRDSDCPSDARCQPDPLVASVGDSDGDEVLDPFDNCPYRFNVDQADADGNGVGDACDLGANGGCASESTPLCNCGGFVADLDVRLSRLKSRRGEQRLEIKGELIPPSDAHIPIRQQQGVQVLVEDLGQSSTPVFELSHRNVPIPPVGAVCDARDGWAVHHSGTSYRNRSGKLDAPTCTRGSAQGLRQITLHRRSASSLDFVLKTRRTKLVPPAGPLRVTLVLGNTAADGDAGHCAVSAPIACTRHGDTMHCR